MAFPATLPESLRPRVPAGVSLFPRPEKRRWVIGYETGGGRKQHVIPGTITGATEALEYTLTWLATKGINPGAVLERRRDSGPSVGDIAEKWIALVETDPRVAPATLKGYRYHLRAHILPHWRDEPVLALAPPPLRAWIRRLSDDGVGARTVNHAVSAFAAMLDVALAEGWLPRATEEWVRVAANPLKSRAVRSALPETDDPDPQALPLAWVQRLISAAADIPLERRAQYVVTFCGGLRPGELAGIQLSRVHRDIKPANVEITVSVATVGAKVGTAWAKPKKTKTRSSMRTLPLHDAALAAIDEWVTRGLPVLLGRAVRPDDYLFPRPDGKPARPRAAELLRADLKTLGLPEELRGKPIEFKAGRASFATWLDDAGVDPRVRKRLMGHRVTDVTERHYTARELIQFAGAVDAIALTWPTAGTLCPAVPVGTTSADNYSESLSHLRDLNSRPTVYEGVDLLAPKVPHAKVSGRKRRMRARCDNGLADGNGARGSDIAGAAEPPPRSGATSLGTGWIALEGEEP